MPSWRELLRRGRWLIFAFVATVIGNGPALAATISPLTGLDLTFDKDTVLLSQSGNLQFSDFAVFGSGELDPVQVEALSLSTTANGLELNGPLSVSDGDEAEFYLLYRVTVLGAPVNGVDLSAETEVVPGGFPSFAKVFKSLFPGDMIVLPDGNEFAIVNVENLGGVVNDSDSASFSPQTPSFLVLDSVRLDSGGPGGSAAVSLLGNEFSVVPEPVSSVLLGTGLLGLGLAGRRPRRS